MSKYNFTLDINDGSSASLILQKIKPNSKVLEFGSAHGRMTKYMKEQLNCNVVIVEQDIDAGSEALQFADANYNFVGSDIEDFSWKTLPKDFDYIIFADVLEHLYDPEKVLMEAKEFIKDKGSVLISIPNIAHNAVIIDLLNNNFEYRNLGLCDNTHIRFFTYKTLKSMIKRCGFKIKEMQDTRVEPEHTEFNNSYDNLPAEVVDFLKKKPYGNVYQFIWELIK